MEDDDHSCFAASWLRKIKFMKGAAVASNNGQIAAQTYDENKE